MAVITHSSSSHTHPKPSLSLNRINMDNVKRPSKSRPSSSSSNLSLLQPGNASSADIHASIIETPSARSPLQVAALVGEVQDLLKAEQKATRVLDKELKPFEKMANLNRDALEEVILDMDIHCSHDQNRQTYFETQQTKLLTRLNESFAKWQSDKAFIERCNAEILQIDDEVKILIARQKELLDERD